MTATTYAYRRGPKTARAPRNNPEHDLQVAVCQFLRFALPPDVEWSSSLSGAFLGPSQRSKMKASGLRPGVPDMVLIIPGKGAVWIELKSDVGVVSPDQKRWALAIGAQRWRLCRSVQDVYNALVSWGIEPRASPIGNPRYS